MDERVALGFLVAAPVTLLAGSALAVWMIRSGGDWAVFWLIVLVLPGTVVASLVLLGIGLALDFAAKKRRRRENERGWH